MKMRTFKFVLLFLLVVCCNSTVMCSTENEHDEGTKNDYHSGERNEQVDSIPAPNSNDNSDIFIPTKQWQEIKQSKPF